MNSIIAPLAKDFGYIVKRADKQYGANICEDMVKILREADIVITDLSELNPNVFYELGLREATKGKCITIILDDEKTIPFDIGYTRAIRYKYGEQGIGASNKLREDLARRILAIQKLPWQSCMGFTHTEIADVFKISVVADLGDKNQYELANSLFKGKAPKIVFLMQRSSSLVLNAEQGCREEDKFLKNLRNVVNECDFFYHIISIDGIRSHIKRRNSVFPHFKDFSNNLVNVNGSVAIKKNNPKNESIFFLKKLPKDNEDPSIKSDRQARIFIVEYSNGDTSAVVVQNIGSKQTCFLIEGEKAKEYLQECISFYNTCELVAWQEIKELFKSYQRIEGSRGKA